MSKCFRLGAVAALALAPLLAAAAPAPTVDSVYSSLAGRDCPSVDPGIETANFAMECPGVDGFRLRVLHDEARASVTVVTPDGKEFPLEYWNVVTRGFSNVDTKAEWRIARGQPIALIVRINARAADADATSPRHTLLTVAKITPDLICVVRAIDQAPDADQNARVAADAAATKPCLQPLP